MIIVRLYVDGVVNKVSWLQQKYMSYMNVKLNLFLFWRTICGAKHVIAPLYFCRLLIIGAFIPSRPPDFSSNTPGLAPTNHVGKRMSRLPRLPACQSCAQKKTKVGLSNSTILHTNY